MAAKRPKKAMLIGLDSVTPVVMNRMIEEGVMPNLARFLERGVFAEAIAPVPPLTHPNWVSIATGSYPSTHGGTCHTVHFPGEPLDVVHNVYTSEHSRAEFLWNAAERAGKRSIIMKYVNAWPPNIQDGVQVAGHGSPEGTDGTILSVGNVFSTVPEAGAQVALQPAEGWQNLPSELQQPLETRLRFDAKRGDIESLYALIARRGEGYDTLVLSKSKDYAAKLSEVGLQEWSDWIRLEVTGREDTDGGNVRIKLVELAADGGVLRLFHSGVHPVSGFTYPESLSAELLEAFGPFTDGHQTPGADPETRLDVISYQADWLANATKYVMEQNPWDLYFLQWWWTDDTGHTYLHLVDPIESSYDEENGPKYWEYFKKEYAICDRLLGNLLELADDDTLVVMISDHGMLNGRTVFINNALRKAGLLVMKEDEPGKPVVDWTRTKAFAQRSIYIYVNLKGRDPEGIVEPGSEYDEVCKQVIDALYDLREPETGLRPVALAMKKEEAALLGVYGDFVGDVVYLMAEGFGTMFAFSEDQVYGRSYKGFGKTGDWRLMEDVIFTDGVWAHHGSQLQGQTYGLSSEKAIFIMAGPGVKQGQTLESPVGIIDAAPTIAHLLGIPAPAQADGRVVREALET